MNKNSASQWNRIVLSFGCWQLPKKGGGERVLRAKVVNIVGDVTKYIKEITNHEYDIIH